MKKPLRPAPLALAAVSPSPSRRTATAGTVRRSGRSAPSGRSAAMSALRVDIPIVADAQAAHTGLGAGRPAQGVQPRLRRGDPRRRPDRRTRRRLRRPDDRVRPQHVPRVLRPSAVHDRERLLPQGEPGWGAGELSAHCESRLGAGNRARHRDGVGDLPEVPHPARRGELGRRDGCHRRIRCSTATSARRSTPLSTWARPRSRTATAARGRSRTRPSSTTTTTIPASRSPRPRATRTTGRSGPQRPRS